MSWQQWAQGLGALSVTRRVVGCVSFSLARHSKHIEISLSQDVRLSEHCAPLCRVQKDESAQWRLMGTLQLCAQFLGLTLARALGSCLVPSSSSEPPRCLPESVASALPSSSGLSEDSICPPRPRAWCLVCVLIDCVSPCKDHDEPCTLTSHDEHIPPMQNHRFDNMWKMHNWYALNTPPFQSIIHLSTPSSPSSIWPSNRVIACCGTHS